MRRTIAAVAASAVAALPLLVSTPAQAADDATVVLVHGVGLVEHRDDPDHAGVHRWLDELTDPDVWIERVVRDGDPVIVLEAVVAERRAQLVVLGTRGVGEGSTAAARQPEATAG